jgi:hypothetical protein
MGVFGADMGVGADMGATGAVVGAIGAVMGGAIGADMGPGTVTGVGADTTESGTETCSSAGGTLDLQLHCSSKNCL